MLAYMLVHIMLRCGRDYLHFKPCIASGWGLLISNHPQNLPIAGRIIWTVIPMASSRITTGTWLQQDFRLTGLAATTTLPTISKLRHIQGLLLCTRSLSHPAAKLCCAKAHTHHGREGIARQHLTECFNQQPFAHPTQLWDNSRSNSTPWHPDFRHKDSKVDLLQSNCQKLPFVESKLATWDGGMNRPPESASTSARGQGTIGWLGSHEGRLEVEVCKKLCMDGRIRDAVDALNLLVQRGFYVGSNLFYDVLKRCMAQRDLVLGMRIHALTIRSGYEGHAFLATHLIGLYASHGRLDEAMEVFAKVSTPDAYNWATIIFAYARHTKAAEAIELYRQMRKSNTVKPTNRIFLAVLKACAAAGDLDAGREVHAHILASSWKPDRFVETGLVDMYAKCRSLKDARQVFDKLPQRDVVTWTAMITGYAQQGMGQEALTLYSHMKEEGITPANSITFACLLQACAIVGVEARQQGKQAHAEIEEKGVQYDVVVGGSLVNMYAKCGSIVDAGSVFERLPEKNVVTWNALLSGYAQQGMGQEALGLYNCMQQESITPDPVTFVSVLQACATIGMGSLCLVKQVHAQIEGRGIQGDVVLGGSLVNVYAKCGSAEDALCIFDRLPDRDVVTWNAMIAGYVQLGLGQEALSLYSRMHKECSTTPDSVTFACLLQACASVGVGALHQGKQLHAQTREQELEDDVLVGNGLVNMYAKCGSLEDARKLFDRLPERNVVTWTAMIAGYVQQGMDLEALTLYSRMQQESSTCPNTVTFVCLLQACASLGVRGLHPGKQLHAHVEERGLQGDGVVGATLVSMYAKCGSTVDARSMFDSLQEKDVVTWNAMFGGYAHQGLGEEALSLYQIMQQEGLSSPDAVTAACLLQACASVGLGGLVQGKQLHAQIEERRLQDDVVVGGSLVNMYAKCGSLEDARKVFDKLSAKNLVTWNSMLAGYAQQGMGQEALALYSRMLQQDDLTADSVTYVSVLQACACVADLPLGKDIHAQIEERELQVNVVVGAALVNMYAKCGSMPYSQQVFDSLPEKSIEAWGALIAGYSRHGDSEIVFYLLDRMRLENMQPNSIVFLSVLTVCSHVGLVGKGRKYFETMSTDCGICPTMEHYTCMMDLLGRAGYLDEALQMAKAMPFPPDGAVWLTLLSACQKWKNIDIGKQAFESAVSVDGKDASPYVLMSNIYASAQMWEEANEMQVRRVRWGAWKEPGQSWWTDMSGVVHKFVVGGTMHCESAGIPM